MSKGEITGSGETDGGVWSGFGVDKEELEGRIGKEGSEEVVKSPLQSIIALLAVVDSDHHQWFLSRVSHGFT